MSLNQKQIDELNKAHARLGTAQEGDLDRQNIQYAQQKFGWQPLSSSQSVARQGASYQIGTPTQTRTTFKLEDFQNRSSFMEAAKDIIMKKQGMNQDIQTARQYYRTIGADTSPFGGTRDPGMMEKAGLFTDERFRQLAPQDQASVRASRTSAMQAATRGLTEEESYRQGRVEDVVRTFSDLYAEAAELRKEDADKEKNRLDNLKSIYDLGGTISAEHLYNDKRMAIDNRIGGSASWRNNNPLNIKWGSFAQGYAGAKQGSNATDGGTFATFQSVEQGWQAAKDLISSKNYKDLSLEQALRRWSGQGYGVEKLKNVLNFTPMWINKKTGEMNEDELNELLSAMVKLEGWTEGTYFQGEQQQDQIEPSDAKKMSLLQSLGVDDQGKPIISTNETTNWTADDWIALEASVRDAHMNQAIIQVRLWEEQSPDRKGSELYAKLQKEYGGKLTSADLATIMISAGYENVGDMFSGSWEKVK